MMINAQRDRPSHIRVLLMGARAEAALWDTITVGHPEPYAVRRGERNTESPSCWEEPTLEEATTVALRWAQSEKQGLRWAEVCDRDGEAVARFNVTAERMSLLHLPLAS